jgi:hypothetical protein
MLEVFSLAPLTTFYSDTYDWLDLCSTCDIDEQYDCSTKCVVPVAFPTVPVYNPYNVVSCN